MKARDYRAIARTALSGNWALSIGITLVAAIMGASITGGNSAVTFSYNESRSNHMFDQAEQYLWANGHNFVQMMEYAIGIIAVFAVVAMIISLARFVIGGAATLGLRQYYIDLVTKRQPVKFGTLVSRFHYFGRALLLRLAITAFSILWSMVFLVPVMIIAIVGFVSVGISAASSSWTNLVYILPVTFVLMLLFCIAAIFLNIFLLRYNMAPYIMTQYPEIKVLEAINRSKMMMRGNLKKLFFLHLSFIGWGILAVLTFGIGLLWLNPYVAASDAAFYLYMTGQLPGQMPAMVPPPYGQMPYVAGPYMQDPHSGNVYGVNPYAQASYGYAPPVVPPIVPTEAPPIVPTEAPPTVPSEAPPTVPSEAPPTVPSEAPPTVPSEAPPIVPTEAPPTVPSEAPPIVPTEAPPQSKTD